MLNNDFPLSYFYTSKSKCKRKTFNYNDAILELTLKKETEYPICLFCTEDGEKYKRQN